MDYRIRVGNEDKIVHSSEYLAHYGILGMKWGIRRYQNENGSLTEAGAKRYSRKAAKDEKRLAKKEAKGDYYRELGANRLKRRAEVANYRVDKYASQGGWKKTMSSADYNKKVKEIKTVAKDISEDRDRLTLFGERTDKNRIHANVGIGTIVGTGVVAVGIAATNGLAGLAAASLLASGAGTAGLSYYKKTLKY